MRAQRRLPKALTDWFLILIVFMTSSCGNPSGQSTSSPSKPSEPSRETIRDNSQRETDQSLQAEEYVRQGLPAPGKVWSGADMMKANSLLASYPLENSVQLPRYKSTRSGAVFARMTPTETMPVFTNWDVPVQTRLGQVLDYCDGRGPAQQLIRFVRRRR